MDRPPDVGGIERVAVIGLGAVGATTAYAMLQAGIGREILLADKDRMRAEGECMDLQHCLPFTQHVALRVVDTAEIHDADLVIVTAGAAQRPGESRLDLVQRNVEIFKTIFPMLSERNPSALFLIVTNPVDIMTRVTLRLTGLPPAQVIGSGTVLDTARFRTLVSGHCGILPRHVHAHVIGEHGDSEVLVWSRACIGPFRVAEYCDLHGISLNTDDIEAINREVREAAYKIIERKGATHFAIGLATVHLAEALSFNLDSVYTVSRQCEGVFGLREVCLSVPTLINRRGAHTSVELGLSDSEQEALLKSAEILDRVYEQIRL